jgi:hypothetical protein
MANFPFLLAFRWKAQNFQKHYTNEALKCQCFAEKIKDYQRIISISRAILTLS